MGEKIAELNLIKREDTELAPIVLFVFNRLEHAKKSIDLLEKCDLAEESVLYIFSDKATDEKNELLVNKVREYVFEKETNNKFKKVIVVAASEHKGLANSISTGVTSVIEEYGKVIVLEDDLYVTPDYLKYMNGALDYYGDNEKIWSIAGYGYDLKSLKSYDKDVYLLYRGCSWGWATWKDRWESVDWDVPSYGTRQYYLKERIRFMRGGNDLPSMLKAQIKGKIDSWAVVWCFSQSNQDKYTVYPKISRIKNDGFGNGTHSLKKDEKKYVTSKGEIKECVFSDMVIDKKIAREFKHLYNLTLWGRVEGKIRMEVKCWKRSRQANN